MNLPKLGRPRHVGGVAALLLSLLGPHLAAHAGGTAQTPALFGSTARDARSDATDRIIVKYSDDAVGAAAGASAAEQAVLHRAARGVFARHGLTMRLLRHGAFDAHVMQLDRRLPLAEAQRVAAEIAASDPDIDYAEPDRILYPLFTPNDTQYGQQWQYFESTGGLNLPAAWDKSTGSGIVVAVLDTGYRPHADLAANIVAGYDIITDTFVANDGNGRDSDAKDPGDAATAGACGSGSPAQDETSSWHGTHVAGSIAAVTNNGSGVAGVAFGAKVQPVRVLGRCGGYTSDIADGIVWASGGSVSGLPSNPTPSRVINMSLGGSGACDATTQNAISSARSRSTVVVVAAGNSNADAAGFSPASCSGVITVAATNRSGGRAYYSNYGASVEVAAPGGDTRSSAADGILSTLNAGATTPGADSFAYYQGTSMATPHVAGVVALMLAKNASLTPDEVSTRLRSSARSFPGACSGCGSGIVDANAAVDAASGTTTPPSNTAEAESNNTPATAQSVARPVTIDGTLASNTDTDYFKVTLANGQSLSATLTPNSGSDYDLYLYKGSTQVASSTKDTGLADSASATNTGAAATYYIRVVYYGGRTGTSGTYKLGLN